MSAWTVVLASEKTKGLAESAVEIAGQFDSVEEAQEAAERYRSQFPTTYQRFIEEGGGKSD